MNYVTVLKVQNFKTQVVYLYWNLGSTYNTLTYNVSGIKVHFNIWVADMIASV